MSAGPMGRLIVMTPAPGQSRGPLQVGLRLLALLAGLGLIIFGQRQMMADNVSELRAVAFYVAGVAGVITAAWGGLLAWNVVPSVTSVKSDFGFAPAPPAILTVTGVISLATTIARAYFRTGNTHSGDITVSWFVTMGLFGLASIWGRWELPARGIGRRIVRSRWSIGAGLLVLAIAAFARFWDLARFATVFDSDEAFFIMKSREARNGDVLNPYHLFFFSVPELYLAVAGWISRPFPDSIGSYRLLSALCGVITVYATWRIGRRFLGESIGLMGAAVLALMPLHVWASRNGLNNVFDSTTLAVPILLADRAIVQRSRGAAFLCGIVLGLGLFGYYGSRIFLPIVIMCAIAALILPGYQFDLRAFATTTWWIVLGFASGAAPIIAHYLAFPSDFTNRLSTVSTENGHTLTILDRLTDIGRSIIYPILDGDRSGGMSQGFFSGLFPMLGWAIAPLIMIGGAAWVVWFIAGWIHPHAAMPRPVMLLIVWSAIGAGVAQTEDIQSQRYLAVTWVWALAAATGLAVLGLAFRSIIGTNWVTPGVLSILSVGAVCAIGIWHASYYFSEDRQLSSYSNEQTIAAYDLGWRFSQLETPPTTWQINPRYVSYTGFGNWRFQAPALADHYTLITENNPAPVGFPVMSPDALVVTSPNDLSGPTCAILAANPTLIRGTAYDRYGHPIYEIYSTGPTLILPTTTSPAGSSLVQSPLPTCP